jgi:hypothetical protein
MNHCKAHGARLKAQGESAVFSVFLPFAVCREPCAVCHFDIANRRQTIKK